MSDETQTATTTAENPAAVTTTDVTATTSPAALDETAATADTADMPEGGAGTMETPEAEPAPKPPAKKPWDGTDSLDVHVKLEHLWAWAQDEMAKLHDRIDALMGGQAQNVETTAAAESPPAKEA